MKVKKTDKSDNEVVLLVSVDLVELEPIKEHILKDHFAKDMKIPGFRTGKVPLHLVEKNVDQAKFESTFLDEALNRFYSTALNDEKLRPVDQPTIQIKKFIPYTLLEFEAIVPVLGKITLPDYKKIKLAKDKIKPVSAKEIDGVLDRLQQQLSDKVDVSRASVDGDQVYIDFSGVDSKGNPVSGATGENYPLVLGSNAFIPGFETNLIGLKPGDKKTFKLRFPKDYGVKALADKEVTFTAEMVKIQEIKKNELDDKFAEKVGPFKSLTELKADIKKQLTLEKENNADRDYESKLLKEITSKSKLVLPDSLVKNEINERYRELTMNLSYRGQTPKEFLDSEGMSEDEYKEQVIKPEAEDRLKASIVLTEVAELEKVTVSEEETTIRLNQMTAQYQDPQSQEDLKKPEARQNIANRLLAEKTIATLTRYSTSSR